VVGGGGGGGGGGEVLLVMKDGEGNVLGGGFCGDALSRSSRH
jgi:hypothetical protein